VERRPGGTEKSGTQTGGRAWPRWNGATPKWNEKHQTKAHLKNYENIQKPHIYQQISIKIILLFI
jgi:hypothetical protein